MYSMQKIELIFETKNQDKDEVKSMEIRFPNQKNRLWVKARYFFLFGTRIGLVFHYD